MPKTNIHLGAQIRIVFEGCLLEPLVDLRSLHRRLKRTARLAGLTVVRSCAHRYHPQGATIVLILKESHLVLHTWPEYGAVIVELFSCALPVPAGRIAASLKAHLGASRQRLSTTPIRIRGK